MSTISKTKKAPTKTGTMLLTSAAHRDDQQVTRPDTMSPGSFIRAISTLLTGGFISSHGDEDGANGDDGKPGRLIITPAGLQALGKEPEVFAEGSEIRGALAASAGETTVDARSEKRPSVVAFGRPGSKHAQVVALLSRPDGATVTELLHMTGWLPHTLRGMLSGLRKLGFVVNRTRNASTGTTYFIRDEEPERRLDEQNLDDAERRVA